MQVKKINFRKNIEIFSHLKRNMIRTEFVGILSDILRYLRKNSVSNVKKNKLKFSIKKAKTVHSISYICRTCVESFVRNICSRESQKKSFQAHFGTKCEKLFIYYTSYSLHACSSMYREDTFLVQRWICSRVFLTVQWIHTGTRDPPLDALDREIC